MKQMRSLSNIAALSILCVVAVGVFMLGETITRSDALAMDLRYGHNYPTFAPAHKGAEAFKAAVESNTKGRLKVQIYPAMQLGSNREQLESLQQGAIQIDLQPTAIAGNFLPELQIFDLPYLFTDAKSMWRVLDGDYGKKVLARLEKKGIHGFGFVWTGFKQITANKPIRKVEDLKGLKIRVMNSPLLIAQFKGWGANPVPIDFGELYNALQQGVVDGQENPYWSNAIQKYYEVQSHLCETDHAALPAVLMGNKAWYDGLSPEDKKTVDGAAREAILADREEMTKVDAQSKKVIIDHKIPIFTLPPAERERLKAAAEPAYRYAEEKLGADAVKEILNAVKAVQ